MDQKFIWHDIMGHARKYQNLSGYLRIDLCMTTANFCVVLVLFVVCKVYSTTFVLININSELDLN